MLPADVAERVLAAPGTPERGLISVVVQWLFDGEIVRRLGPGAFRPPPKIDSAFVLLTRHEPPACSATPAHQRNVVVAAFAHRRKTLRNNFRHRGWSPDDIEVACQRAGVSPSDRAEALEVEDFAELADALPESEA